MGFNGIDSIVVLQDSNSMHLVFWAANSEFPKESCLDKCAKSNGVKALPLSKLGFAPLSNNKLQISQWVFLAAKWRAVSPSQSKWTFAPNCINNWQICRKPNSEA